MEVSDATNSSGHDHSSSDYGAEFFDQHVDREGVFTVKYDLRTALFGQSAANAIPLWIADMDLPCSREIIAALQHRLEHPTFGYTIQPTEMWAAVMNWLQEEHGWKVASDAFVFAVGVVPAASISVWAFSSPGDTVVVMTPLYEPLQILVEKAGRKLRGHQLRLEDGRYMLDRDRLQEDLRGSTILIFCNPHNPGGASWTKEEIHIVANLCHQENVLVISDEIWADWCLFGHRHTPLATVATTGQEVVTLMAPTKTWNIAGMQASYLVIEDAKLRERYLDQVSYSFLHFGSTFATEATLAAYQKGRPWLQGARQHVESQLLHCKSFLQSRCSPEVKPLLPEATYLIWLDCTELGENDPAQFFKDEAGVVLSPGSDFGGESTAHFARLNTATSRAVLQEALDRMAAAVERKRATKSMDT